MRGVERQVEEPRLALLRPQERQGFALEQVGGVAGVLDAFVAAEQRRDAVALVGPVIDAGVGEPGEVGGVGALQSEQRCADRPQRNAYERCRLASGQQALEDECRRQGHGQHDEAVDGGRMAKR